MNLYVKLRKGHFVTLPYRHLGMHLGLPSAHLLRDIGENGEVCSGREAEEFRNRQQTAVFMGSLAPLRMALTALPRVESPT